MFLPFLFLLPVPVTCRKLNSWRSRLSKFFSWLRDASGKGERELNGTVPIVGGMQRSLKGWNSAWQLQSREALPSSGPAGDFSVGMYRLPSSYSLKGVVHGAKANGCIGTATQRMAHLIGRTS